MLAVSCRAVHSRLSAPRPVVPASRPQLARRTLCLHATPRDRASGNPDPLEGLPDEVVPAEVENPTVTEAAVIYSEVSSATVIVSMIERYRVTRVALTAAALVLQRNQAEIRRLWPALVGHQVVCAGHDNCPTN